MQSMTTGGANSASHPGEPPRAGIGPGSGEAAAPGATPDVQSLSFEDALSELEGIVRRLEDGRARLEDAIRAYERGSALRRHCERKLAEAEAKVQAIVEGPDGVPTGLRDAGE